MSDFHHYVPIECGFYDELLMVVIRKTPVRIILKGSNEVIRGVIQNVYTRNKSEYCSCNNIEIRLDAISKLCSIQNQ